MPRDSGAAVARVRAPPSAPPYASILTLLFLAASASAYFALRAPPRHAARGFFDVLRPSEEAAAFSSAFFARAAAVDARHARALAAAAEAPLHAADADALWHVAALDRVRGAVGAAAGNGSAAAPFIVYTATTWFGEAFHAALRGLAACPARGARPPCAAGFYPAPLRALWPLADVALYHRAGGAEERVMPPPSGAAAPRTRHALLAAENFGALFRAPHAARFNAEVSYRRRGLLRDGDYEAPLLARAAWPRAAPAATFADLAPAPLPPSERFRDARAAAGAPSDAADSAPSDAFGDAPFARAATVFFASSHCHSRSGREELVAALEAHVAVDVYGGGCLAAPWRRARGAARAAPAEEAAPWAAQAAAQARYKFTLAFENARCGDYVTEKAFRALARGSVPVYLGAPNAADFMPGADSFIDAAAFPSAAALGAHLRALDADDAAYAALHAWRARPFASYGGALQAYLRRALPLANWSGGDAALNFACRFCYALADEAEADTVDAAAADAAAAAAGDAATATPSSTSRA